MSEAGEVFKKRISWFLISQEKVRERGTQGTTSKRISAVVFIQRRRRLHGREEDCAEDNVEEEKKKLRLWRLN